jgi:multiple sugar transport system permease protein
MTAMLAAAVRLRTNGLSDRQLAFLFVLPAAVLLVLFAIYPFAVAAYNGFFNINFVTGARTWDGLSNYAAVLGNSDIQAAFGRSVVWTVANLVIQTTLGLAIALLLNAELHGQTIARGLVLFPYMVPAIVAALVFRYMFNDVVGIVDYLLQSWGVTSQPLEFLASPQLVLPTLIVVNCWKYTPFMVIVFLARLQTVPGDLIDAGSIDGAGRFGIFRYIILPWLRPVLLVAMLLRTIWTANDFDIPYLLAFGGPLQASTTVPLKIQALAFSQRDIGLASSLAVCVAILLVVAAYFYLRAYRQSEREVA